MNNKKIYKYSIILFSIILSSTALVSLAHKNELIPENDYLEKQDMVNMYPANKNGQTYGTDIYGNNTEINPDLLAVYSDDNTFGYIKYDDLVHGGKKPNTPEEAVKYQTERNLTRVLPVYDKEGENVISYFTLQNHNINYR